MFGTTLGGGKGMDMQEDRFWVESDLLRRMKKAILEGGLAVIGLERCRFWVS